MAQTRTIEIIYFPSVPLNRNQSWCGFVYDSIILVFLVTKLYIYFVACLKIRIVTIQECVH